MCSLIATTDDQSTALSTGDLVKVVNTSASIDYQIETVTAVNSTVITVGNDISFDNTQADLFKIDTHETELIKVGSFEKKCSGRPVKNTIVGK